MYFLVIPPIHAGMQGPQVVNLGNILMLLLERRLFRALDPPNSPTADELSSLATRLTREIAAAIYGDAMRQLVLYFQIQEGFGDVLNGVVEESTARRLNEIMERLVGPLPPQTPPPVDTRPPAHLRMLSVFNLSFHISTRKFFLRYRLEGEAKDRSLSLTLATLSALLAVKASAKYFVFNTKTKSFVATDDLLK